MRYIIREVLLTLLCLLLGMAAACGEILQLPMDFSGGTKPQRKYEHALEEYSDPSIQVIRETVKSAEWGATYYVLRVKIANPSQLRTVSAGGFDNIARVAPADVMVNRVNAVVACAGDFYHADAGRFVLRQGQVFRENMSPEQDLLLIDEDGDFHILLADEHPETMDKTQINGKKVVNALCFGPALVKDGQKACNLAVAPYFSEPLDREQRCAICQVGPLEYMIVGCAHFGLSMSDFTDLIMSLDDVQQAYNLDGGNSTQMIFLGARINNTASPERRLLADMVYFASAYQPD